MLGGISESGFIIFIHYSRIYLNPQRKTGKDLSTNDYVVSGQPNSRTFYKDVIFDYMFSFMMRWNYQPRKN